jgi:hypothetical protein
MRIFLKRAKQDFSSWAFPKPVSKNETSNYFEIVKHSMDPQALEKIFLFGDMQNLKLF